MISTKAEPINFKVPSGDIKTTLLSHENSSGKLAVVLPGARCSWKQPLLYFAVQVLLKIKFDVLAIEKIYGEDRNWAKITTFEKALSAENCALIPISLGASLDAAIRL